MKTILNRIRTGERYTDGINEIIFGKNKFFHRSVFRGGWTERTEDQIKEIINTHNEICKQF